MPQAQEQAFVVDDASACAEILPPGAGLKKLAGGFRAADGPAWTDAEGGYLLFADIIANKRFLYSSKQAISILRGDGKQAGGHAFDLPGRVVTCELAGRRLSRTEKDGSITPLAERYSNKKLNGPAAVVVRSDGTIWFTDIGNPTRKEPLEQPGRYVFRLDLKGAHLTAVITDMEHPGGLSFSPDESKLYVSEAGSAKTVRVFDVVEGKALSNGRDFCTLDSAPHGMTRDPAGRLFVATDAGLYIFSDTGRLIAHCTVPHAPSSNPIEVGKLTPDATSACCFGEAGHKTLYVTSRASLYAVTLNG